MSYKYKELFIINIYFLATFCLYFILSALLYKPLSDYAAVPVDLLLLIISPLFFLRLKKIKANKIFRFNKISVKSLVLVIIGAVFALLGAQIIASFASYFYNLIGKSPKAQVSLKTTTIGITFQFIVSAFFVPFSEEFLFRGFMQGLYRKLKVSHGIIITALLFSLVHIQFHIVIGTFFAAIAWGYFVKYTKTLVSSVVSHIIFNSAALLMMYNKPDAAGSSVFKTSAGEVLTLSLVFVIACVGIISIIMFLKRNYTEEDEQEEDAGPDGEINAAKAWSPLFLFAAIIVFFSVSVLMN